MNQIPAVLLLLILVSCVNIEATETPVPVNTAVISTSTNIFLPSTPLPTDVPSIIFTPEIPCDPFRVVFCITEGHFIFQRPIQPPGNDLVDATYRYGSTANGTRDPHHGVEFSNPSGTPVYAVADGTVIFAGPDTEAIYSPWQDFYGNLAVIEHNDELFTLYAHLSRIDVEVKQKVLAGDKIGEVGWTGGAIGSHLHFEVRQGNAANYFATQNPELWLVPAKDENGNLFGTLVISVVDGDGNLLRGANFTIGFHSDPSQSPVRVYYETTYSPDMLTGEENAVVGDLPAGHYRIAVEMNGQILDRWVEVQSGKLTQIVFVVR
jgi:hypothetical protein